ncbi:MAG TPA: UbiA-like polyprenyltransferase [Gemmatimonadales bacterium]|jgi:4-hydroxybenzoate polyprenyltransferase
MSDPSAPSQSSGQAIPPARRSAEGQTFGGESLLVRYVNFVKLPHTLFALPFALLGVLAASLAGAPVTIRTVALVVLAFSAARWAAMGFNRIADRVFDAQNPRTMQRELPRGAITLTQAWVSVVLASAIFIAAAGSLNRLCLLLSPVALAWILGYSLTKRFTWWPHLWLGLSLAIAPVGGYLAVTGRWSEPAWPLFAVATAVATWVAGFDIFYALPDEGFDRSQGLRSAVVRLGESRAILLAKLLHAVTLPALALFGYGMGFGPWYYAGLVVAAGILVYEHGLVRPGDLSRLDAAFFTMNGIMSVTVFGFALLDRLAG